MSLSVSTLMTTLPRRIAFLILLCLEFPFSANRCFEAKANAAPRPQQCRKAVFSGSINGGEPYSRELGSGLTLKLIPLKDNWGWEIQVRPHGRDDDYGYPLNPPLRGGNEQYLGTGYGLTAREQLSHEHEVRFLLDAADYQRIFKLASHALWPYQAPNPDNAAQLYFDGIAKARSGLIRLAISGSETNADGSEVKWMRFDATVIVPSSFEMVSDLKSVGAECPAQPEAR
jgi:hypothetical protein